MTITERLHAKMKHCQDQLAECRQNLADLAPQADARHDEAAARQAEIQKKLKAAPDDKALLEESAAVEHVRAGMFAAGEYCRGLVGEE